MLLSGGAGLFTCRGPVQSTQQQLSFTVGESGFTVWENAPIVQPCTTTSMRRQHPGRRTFFAAYTRKALRHWLTGRAARMKPVQLRCKACRAGNNQDCLGTYLTAVLSRDKGQFPCGKPPRFSVSCQPDSKTAALRPLPGQGVHGS